MSAWKPQRPEFGRRVTAPAARILPISLRMTSILLHDNILGGNRVTTDRQVPFCMFTDPEFALIGLSETEARDRGIACRLA